MADEHERKSGDQVGDVSRRRFIELVAASTAAGVGLRAGRGEHGGLKPGGDFT